MRIIETGSIFRMQKRKLGEQQKKTLVKIIKELQKNPEIRTQNKGDLEKIWGYLYEDNLGKVYLAYRFDQNSITLISFSRISVRI